MASPPDPLRHQALAVFERLLDLDEAARERTLAALAASQPLLHARALDLLRADASAQAQDFLDGAALDQMAASVVGGAGQAGAQLGPYRLESRIGTGGMGEVWLARRIDGLYEGLVAIKLLHTDLYRPGLRERAVRERQILARLQHPSIARLLDAGSSTEGAMYLVLEYVDGSRIDRWCDEHRLDLAARLGLFLDVCAAVAHAHSHLVVHRDLKPSNILVSADGRVKLLDFGIAKLIEGDGESAEETELTRLAGRLLTPEYAAPEQILGQTVTTATDVYALGVLLHLLLAGGRPFGTGKSTATRLEREVLESEPRTLSRTLSVANGEGLTPAQLAERRASTPDKLRRQLRGDLENIVAKALKKNPVQRYGTVPALAEDIRRHLRHEPISARGESFAYRSAKFMRRHRLGMATASAFTVAVLAGVGGVVWQAHLARAQAREAELQTRRAESVKEFMINVFKAADPENSQNASMSAREVLDQGVRQMQSQLDTEPALQADLYDTLSQTYLNLGVGDRAAELARTALAARRKLYAAGDTRIAESLLNLGEALIDVSKFKDAHAALSEAMEIMRAAGDRDSLLAAQINSAFADADDGLSKRDEAIVAQRRAYAICLTRFGPDAPETARQQLDLAERLEEAGRYTEAEQNYRAAIHGVDRGIGPESLAAGNAHMNFASLLDRTGHSDEAGRELDLAVAILGKVLGDNHPLLGDALFSRAILYTHQNRSADAEADLRRSLRIFPVGSYKAAQSQRYLGIDLTYQGRYAEAREALESSVAIFRKSGPDEQQQYRALADLATSMLRSGHAREAEPMLREAIQNLERLVGADGYEVRNPLKRLGEDLIALGRNDEAVTVLERVRALEIKLFGTEQHRDMASTDYLLGKALFALGTPQSLARARPLAAQAVSLDRQYLPGGDLGRALLLRARLALAAADSKAAHPDLVEALDQLDQAAPPDPADAAEVRRLLRANG